MHQKQSTGFSLLELLLVFAIAAALVFVGINQYKRLSREKDIEAVKYNVALVKNASINYYRKHIADPFNPDTDHFNTQKLCDIWPKLLKTKLIADNSCTDKSSYAVSALPISTPTPPTLGDTTYQFTVKITLTESANIGWLKNLLNATEASGSTLSWKYLPTYSIPTMNTGLWILNTNLQQFKKAATLPPNTP